VGNFDQDSHTTITSRDVMVV
jgi:hypothetical protein